jgi:dTDP-4-amino-4,6-dideoxygalactose transaminase
VITQPNSWISTASSIVFTGARPVFADVREDFTIDPDRVEAAITPRTKAVLPVHLTGRCADMEAIGAIAQQHGLAVIEDAAQAAGARRKGRAAGSFGVVGCFSFHPLKNLSGIGDGGMVVTRDAAVAERLRLLRNHGLRTRDEAALWGFNSRLDTVHAAVLRCRLKRLAEVTETRRRHAARYRAALSGVVTCPVDRPDEYAIYHLFMIQCGQRDALQRCLTSRRISTKIHYPIPIHLQPCSRDLGYQAGDFPAAEAQAQRILSLPVHQSLSDDQIDYVAHSIREFFEGR